MWISDAFPIPSHSFDGSNWILSFPHALCVAKCYAGSRQVKGKANPIPIFQPVPREAGGQVQVERGMNRWPTMNRWSLDDFGSAIAWFQRNIDDVLPHVFHWWPWRVPLGPWVFNVLKPRQLVPVVWPWIGRFDFLGTFRAEPVGHGLPIQKWVDRYRSTRGLHWLH